MNQPKLKSALEVASGAAAIIVACLFCLSLVLHHFSSRSSFAFRRGVAKGDHFSQVKGIDYGASSKTLLIALSTDCRSCVESVDFYKRLSTACAQARSDIQLVALFPQSETEVNAFNKEMQLKIRTVANVNLKKLPIVGTPWIVLLNKDGAIINFWIGKPSDKNDEEAIAAAVT